MSSVLIENMCERSYHEHMKLNPYINAVCAAGYIFFIGLLFVFTARANAPDTFLAPIMMLSLLVFSVATMAFLFFYQPVVLLIEKKQREAVMFFLKTLATFGVITAVVFAIGAQTMKPVAIEQVREAPQASLPTGYTLSSYTVAEKLSTSCDTDEQCETPGSYLMRSNCPYTTICVQHSCTVVCPEHEAQTAR